jgi:uroporphyrinogen-III decarboxylase
MYFATNFFGKTCDLAGVQNMMMQLMMDPDFVNRLMDKCMITAKDFAKAQIEAGCEITVLTPPENLKVMNEARV